MPESPHATPATRGRRARGLPVTSRHVRRPRLARRPLEALIDDQIAGRRLNTWLLTAFGIAALALTSIGLYGLLAYLVAVRRHEIAVRLSLGATPFRVFLRVLGHVALIVGVGVSLGLAGAFITATGLGSLLFGTTPWDFVPQATTIAVLGMMALIASWIPARRAMGIDPATVLRTE